MAVLDQFGADKQPLAANFADHRVFFLKRQQVVKQPMAHRLGVVDQLLVFDDPHVFQRRCRPCRATAEGRDIAEIGHRVARVVLELVEHCFRRHCTGNRRIARGDTLGHGHEIGLDAVMLIAEPGAGATDTADHFIDMQQNIVFAADLLHPLPVAGGRSDDAATGGDRLQTQAAYGIGAFAQDHLLDRVGCCLAIAFGVRVLAAVFKTMRHHHETGRQWSVLFHPLWLPAGRQRGQRGAVIIPVTVEDLVFLAAMMPMRDLPDHLEGLLVGL